MRFSLAATGVATVGLCAGLVVSGCAGGSSTAGGGGSGSGASGPGGGTGCVPATEICDGIDNDCNGQVDEGCACTDGDMQDCFSGDPALVGTGRCAIGSQTCDSAGAWGACEGEVLSTDEVCNTEDDDCDGQIDEGFGTVTCGLGLCQVTVDECDMGVPNPCEPGQPEPAELCNGGIDDDCDGEIDEGCACDDGDTQPCYTGSMATKNVGECSDGEQTCANGAWGACVGDVTPTTEICNGLDENCNGTPDDGDPGGGSVCSSGQSGICGTGVFHCVADGMGGASVVCVPNQMPMPDVCNNADDDCDPNTPDGSAESNFGMPCDGGSDGDLCEEGVWECNGGVMSCSDDTDTTIDVCGGGDDDCDPASSDGSEDPLNGQPCDGTDSDQCNEGTWSCSNGQLACSDNTPNTLEQCNGMDDDCDGMTDEGFNLNSNPLCTGGLFNMGSVSGDTNPTGNVATDIFFGESWNVVQITEDDSSIGGAYLSAHVVLTVPAGMDYDLYVYCNDCMGGLAGSSTTTSTAGHQEVVEIRSNDDFAVDDGFNAIIEIRHKSDSGVCAPWQLDVYGYFAVSTETCN